MQGRWPESRQTTAVGSRVRPAIAEALERAAAERRVSRSALAGELLTRCVIAGEHRVEEPAVA
jgi:hypothetical protein